MAAQRKLVWPHSGFPGDAVVRNPPAKQNIHSSQVHMEQTGGD